MSERDEKLQKLDSEDVNTLGRLFIRKKPLKINIINFNDITDTRKILNDFRQKEKKDNIIQEIIKDINPETDIVIPKSQLELIDQMKNISAIADSFKLVSEKIDNISLTINDSSSKITNVHARMTNDLTKKEKPLTKKQRDEAEIERLSAEAYNRVRLNGYKVK